MINRIILMGRLTADPELKATPNNVSVSTFSIAVERSFADSSSKKPVDFIPCVAWRQTGEFVSKYFSKGDMIAIEGSLQTRKYTDKDGNIRNVYEVIVDKVSFCGINSNSTANPQQTPAKTTANKQSYQPPKQQQSEPKRSFEIGDFAEFEELDNEDGLPF